MAPGKAFGVGLACVSTVFGSGSDPAFALVEIDPAGRITVTSQAVEIGTGIATALAVRVADRLGIAADEVKLGVLDGLGRARAGRDRQSVHASRRAAAGRAAKNPRWVPDIAQDTTASISAHIHTAVADEAANVDPSLRPVAGGAGDLVAGHSAARRRASSCASTTCASSTAR